MTREELEQLESELSVVLSGAGYHLLELKAGKDEVLRAIVHREPGITHADCAAVARLVQGWSGSRDGDDPLEQYMLEVSSPGLTRSLKRFSEAAVFTGRRLRVVLREPVNGEDDEVFGTVVSADEGVLNLSLDDGTRLAIEESNIKRMKLAG